MTARGMYEFFDIIIDRFNSPGFDEEDFNRIINSAQNKFVLDVFVNKNPSQFESYNQYTKFLTSLEHSQIESEILKPLILDEITVSSSSSGFISDSSILSGIESIVGPGRSYIHPTMAYDQNRGYYFKFVRHNDLKRFEQNSFKRYTDEKPHILMVRDGFRIYPKRKKTVVFGLLLSPSKIDVINKVDSELPEFCHDDIVFLAVELAGIATRDQILQTMRDGK